MWQNSSSTLAKAAEVHVADITEGSLPFLSTVLLLGAAEGNGTTYKLKTSFFILTGSKAWLAEMSCDMG